MSAEAVQQAAESELFIYGVCQLKQCSKAADIDPYMCGVRCILGNCENPGLHWQTSELCTEQ